MPKVQRENIGLLTDRITVTVDRDDYMADFESALKSYARQANIPGFRKGMVPVGMIRKMYGPSVFADTVIRSVERGLMEHVRELDIFAQPLPDPTNDPGKLDPASAGPYTFSFQVGLKPSFTVADPAQGRFVRYKVDVTDEMVEGEVARKRKKMGTMTEPEKVTSEENVLNVTFEACDESGQVAEGTTSHANSLLVKYFREAYRPKLMGTAKDVNHILTLEEAFEEKERDWLVSDLGLDRNDPEALKKPFRMTVSKIGLIEDRPLDEEFFKEAYPGKEIATEADFREQIRNEIQTVWDRQSGNHLQHELWHYLKDNTSMEFPDEFLRRWLMEGQEKPKTEEEVEAEFPTFKDQLRWTLISDRIVQDQGVQISEEEVRNVLREQVMGYFGGIGLEGHMDWLEGYVDRMMKDRQQVESASRRVLGEKVLQWAESRAVAEERPIGAEAFTGILEEHRHEH
jgi:trigger factor